MPIVVFDRKKYSLDEHGYLDPPEQWDEAFAEGMARRLGITPGLSEDHWRFIEYLRRFYTEHRRIPTVCEACTANALSLERLQALFPSGYRRGACSAAGLPFFS